LSTTDQKSDKLHSKALSDLDYSVTKKPLANHGFTTR